MPLSTEQLDQYRRDGFLVIRNHLDEENVRRWRDRLVEIVTGRAERSKRMLVMKDVMVAKGAVTPGNELEAIAKVQDYEGDPVLDTYAHDERVLEVMRDLIGDEIMSIHTMLINKPPNVDGRHPLHQDLLYFPFRPADLIAASWTALEPVTRENGCLVVVPGSHRGELHRHGRPDWEYVNVAYLGAVDVDDQIEKRLHLEMAPGDTVFFHPLLLHGSGRNRTSAFRRAISAHYSSVEVTWEWAGGDLKRPYRIVTGRHKGEIWSGRRNTESPINPLDYVADSPEELIRVGEANFKRQ
jgi:phytanoyl-CoA hydroxylase